MNRYVRFIVRSDHASRTKCTGVIASLRILSEAGQLPSYYADYARELLDQIDREMPCPPFGKNAWSPDCVCWFKDTAQEWISVFREINAILEDSDFDVATLTTNRPGMIVFEDDIQVVAKSPIF